MEHCVIEKEYEENEGETKYDHREYNIKNENKKYILRLEISEQNIYFIISLDDIKEYNYKTNMSLLTIVNKLSLNQKRYNDLKLILKLFDKIYKNQKIFIKINSDESCYLIIKFINVNDEESYNLKLYKNYMKMDDKFNWIFNQIKLLKNNDNNSKIENQNNKINELNNKINQKDEEIKVLINRNEIIINEMNKKLSEQEIKIKELEKKNNDLLNKNKVEELFNKKENELNNRIQNFENDINNKFFQINEQINNFKEEMNKLNNKMKDQENLINDNQNIMDDILNNIEEMIDDKINNIYNIKNEINKINIHLGEKKEEIKEDNKEDNNVNLNNNIINSNIFFKDNNIEYEKKINHEFIKEPKNLKFIYNITGSNTNVGWNDMFEVFISYKDNKEYLISPNSNNYDLDIFSLVNHQKLKSAKGHKNKIRTIRYFINDKNKNEYLISADCDKIVILWDITNNYNIKYLIDTQYGKDIYSCLLIFHGKIDDTYIITSCLNESKNDKDSATKVYSLNEKNLIKCIKDTNNNRIYYLLSWHNKINDKFYIIQFSNKKIIINNLFEDELYSELIYVQESFHFSGFIYSKDNKDYLCSSSSNGYINIWDLYDKKIFKTFNTKGCRLAHFIEWNQKYFIVADRYNKSVKIIDTEKNLIFDVNSKHNDELISVKKILHPIYGESLLTASRDRTIKLWTIE